MELMELVDNEPTARPFQCDWDGCGKVRFDVLLLYGGGHRARGGRVFVVGAWCL